MGFNFVKFIPFFFLTLFVSSLHSQTITGSIMHDNEVRNYRLHLPPGFSAAESLPLVFNMHGLNSNALEQELYSQMNAVADTANFLVCYPDGLNEQWNVGFNFGNDADDVGFINALIDTLQANYGIDLTRVYACGMSNGGYMSYLLACELTDRIAAIASVAGGIVPGVDDTCQPSRRIPVMQIHGTADAVVPYNGGEFAIPVEDLIAQWVAYNDCPGMTDTIPVPNTNTQDGCTAERINYLDCTGGNEVVFYKIDGGGHSWPNGLINIDVTNRDFSASVEIWRFFNRFKLNAPSSVSEPQGAADFVKILSNPFREKLQLQLLSSDTYQVRVFDQIGRQVYHSNYPGQSDQMIEVAHWTAGVYVIIWETGKAYGSLQVIKS